MMSCGFRRMDAIIKAASQSSRIPCFRKDAAIGIVPYMQRGEAMPRRHAGMMPKRPQRVFCIFTKSPWIRSLAKTEIRDPTAMPMTQYQKICRS